MPIIGKFGAESLTNILADTTLDTVIDTIPSMVELALDGESAGEVALEGLKRTGINLGANGAFEAVFKVGKGVLGGTIESGSGSAFSKNELNAVLKQEELSLEESNNMRLTDVNELTTKQVIQMKNIRESVPKIDNKTIVEGNSGGMLISSISKEDLNYSTIIFKNENYKKTNKIK